MKINLENEKKGKHSENPTVIPQIPPEPIQGQVSSRELTGRLRNIPHFPLIRFLFFHEKTPSIILSF